MHVPPRYSHEHDPSVIEFIRSNGFGLLVSGQSPDLQASHIPLELDVRPNGWFLHGHLSRANRQLKQLELLPEVLLVFSGPHAYVSSSWYEKENVPTWNYQSVHCYGRLRMLTEEELRQSLTGLMHHYEQHREQPLRFNDLSDDLVNRQIRGIAGVEIAITRYEAAWKLSQNRHAEDRENIIQQLEQENDPEAHEMARVMRKFDYHSKA